eukprot:m51a1_g11337 putative adenosine 3 -phospho 5 -phosphosulfate transporter 2-like (413) ;mRNA; r:148270-149866
MWDRSPADVEQPRQRVSDAQFATPAASPAPDRERAAPVGSVTVLGVRLMDAESTTHTTRVRVLIALVMVVYLLFFVLQELIFKKHKCEHGGFVTLVHFAVFWAFGLAERPSGQQRQGPMKYYILLGFFSVFGLLLSNYALVLLNFPTWLMFKSGRALATMLAGMFIQGKRYGLVEAGGVVLIVLGLAVFTLGDLLVLPAFNAPGVVLILLALAMNAAQDNYQEKGMRAWGLGENEIVVYSYGIGCALLVPWLLANGELVAGSLFCWEHPAVFAQIVGSGFLAYAGIVLILSLIRHTSALTTVITTSCRKGLSIVLSFLLFSKPFSLVYLWGGLTIFAGVATNVYGKRLEGARASARAKAARESSGGAAMLAIDVAQSRIAVPPPGVTPGISPALSDDSLCRSVPRTNTVNTA